jgi:ferredoxin
MRRPTLGHTVNGHAVGGYPANGQPQVDQDDATYDDATYDEATYRGGYRDGHQDPATYQAEDVHRDRHQRGPLTNEYRAAQRVEGPVTCGYGNELPPGGHDRASQDGSRPMARHQPSGHGRRPARDIAGNGYRDQDAAGAFRSTAEQRRSRDPEGEFDLDDNPRTPPPPPLRTPSRSEPEVPQRAGWTPAADPTSPPPPLQPQDPGGPRLRVDWPYCRAHGLCHELLPEAVRLDEWGYPIVTSQPLPPHLIDDARRAVISCPTLALRLVG